MKNIIIGHGGGPTSVLNASLAGAIKELKAKGFDGKIYAARFGSKGLFHYILDLDGFRSQKSFHYTMISTFLNSLFWFIS